MSFRQQLPLILFGTCGWLILVWTQLEEFSVFSGSMRGRIVDQIRKVHPGMSEDDAIDIMRNCRRSGRQTLVPNSTACLYFEYFFPGKPHEQVRVWVKGGPSGYTVERVGELEPLMSWSYKHMAEISDATSSQ